MRAYFLSFGRYCCHRYRFFPFFLHPKRSLSRWIRFFVVSKIKCVEMTIFKLDLTIVRRILFASEVKWASHNTIKRKKKQLNSNTKTECERLNNVYNANKRVVFSFILYYTYQFIDAYVPLIWIFLFSFTETRTQHWKTCVFAVASHLCGFDRFI